jgi:hypothetical protein
VRVADHPLVIIEAADIVVRRLKSAVWWLVADRLVA